MGKSKKTTQSTSVDNATQQQQAALYHATNQAVQQGAPGADPYSMMAARNYGQAAGAMNFGLGALQGDPNAYNALANPYQQNVANAMRQQYDVQRQQNMNDVASRATAAGAFGGSRMDIAMGQAMADTNRDENAQMAQLQQGGFNDTMNRAMGLANFGMGANGQVASMGDYLRNLQLQRQGYGSDMLRNNMYQTGSTSTSTQRGNAMSTLGGLATMGLGLFGGPIGSAVGGALGGMMGGGGGGGSAPSGGFIGSPQSANVFGSLNGLGGWH